MEKVNFLALDTSSKVLRLAVKINSKAVTIDDEDNSRHIESLLPAVDGCLKKINCDKSEISNIGVCTGPGSFTGIRIGIAAALGISYASNITCFGFSAFDVYKYLLKDQAGSVIIPVIDAKKERFYCSFIEQDKDFEYFDITPDEIIDKIGSDYKGKRIIFTGGDFKILKDRIKNKAVYAEKFKNGYSSKDLTGFIEHLILTEKKLNYPHPIYIRKSDAEVEYLKKNSLKKT